MSTEFDKLRQIFLAAVEKETPALRAAFLDQACAGDALLRSRLEALVDAHALSGALLDCKAAGLPTVATAHLAEAILAPAFVRTVSDAISAVLLAETVAEIVDSGSHLLRPLDAPRELLAERNFDVYATGLLAAVGIGS